MIKKILSLKRELLLVLLLIVFSGATHGFNMFKYPYYENDEGTYMSQAWSVSEEGNLAPYTYWYDHAPAGWIFIAAWAELTGGYFTFGESVASGRVLMLLLHMSIAGLLYFVTRRLSGSVLAAAIAGLLFSVTPLGMYFQRRILLDNIMVFWSLLSIALLLKDKIKMRHILLSGLAFGIAILTKENAVFFLPALLYGISLHAHLLHKRVAIIEWLAVTLTVTSLYFFYALLKGEFFSVGVGESRVSLLDTLAYQGSRGSGFPFWSPESDFMTTFITWLGKDPYILLFGLSSVLILAGLALRNKKLRMPTLLAAFFWAFLMRGGLIIDFYIVPILPVLALATGITVHKITTLFPQRVGLIVGGALLSIVVLPSVLHNQKHYFNDETTPQLQAVDWIQKNVAAEANIIIENSIYLELRNPEQKFYKNADWYWKVQLDPEIRQDKYNNSWQNVDYMMVSHETLKTIRQGEGDFIETVLKNSDLMASWGPVAEETYLNLEQRKSTNGDWAQIYKVRSQDEAYLYNSWQSYKSTQIISYGQVIDTFNNGRTTSEGQSYALLRAVWQGDKDTFTGVWNWTKDHMQYRTQDKLFSWLWEKKSDVYVQTDSEAATDADQDIALALLFAYRQWGDEEYLATAKQIIADIWRREVVSVNGKNYLVANTNALRDGTFLLNPSYLSPASYRVFAEVDKEHDWLSVVDSSYDVLFAISGGTGVDLRLPSDWLLLNAKTGALTSASRYMSKTADYYGYDAFRVMWRIALDAEWYAEPRAREYLAKYHDFFYAAWKKQELVSVYTKNRQPITEGENISTDVGALAVFTVTDEVVANEFYQERIAGTYDEAGFWEEKNNYYGQNWAWFGTALYAKKLKKW